MPEGSQLGFSWLDQVHADDLERAIESWNEAVRSGGKLNAEFRIRRHDGMYRWFKTAPSHLRTSRDGL